MFALRGIYWALGGTVGLGTLNHKLQDLAAHGDPTVFASLWAAVVMLLATVGCRGLLASDLDACPRRT